MPIFPPPPASPFDPFAGRRFPSKLAGDCVYFSASGAGVREPRGDRMPPSLFFFSLRFYSFLLSCAGFKRTSTRRKQVGLLTAVAMQADINKKQHSFVQNLTQMRLWTTIIMVHEICRCFLQHAQHYFITKRRATMELPQPVKSCDDQTLVYTIL